MPKRSNLFQDVVGLVHRHLAGGAQVEESAFLTNSKSGEPREVDVVVTGEIAGQRVIVSVEATATSRPAGSPWVEHMLGKHSNLPTNKLVLVSDSGFTGPARQLAEKSGAVPVEPQELDAIEAQVASGLASVWLKAYTFHVDQIDLIVDAPGDDGQTRVNGAPHDLWVYAVDGHLRISLGQVMVGLLNASQDSAREALGLDTLVHDASGEFTFQKHEPTVNIDGDEIRLALGRAGSDGEAVLYPIADLSARGRVQASVNEMPLRRFRLNDTEVTFGEAGLLGARSTLVVSGSGDQATATMRIREAGSTDASDYPVKWLSEADRGSA